MKIRLPTFLAFVAAFVFALAAANSAYHGYVSALTLGALSSVMFSVMGGAFAVIDALEPRRFTRRAYKPPDDPYAPIVSDQDILVVHADEASAP